jgi:hypothetical protein
MIIQMNELHDIDICDIQVLGDVDSNFGHHHRCCTCMVPREKEKKEKKKKGDERDLPQQWEKNFYYLVCFFFTTRGLCLVLGLIPKGVLHEKQV